MIAPAWANEVAEFLSFYKNRPWLIALSGGCDSVVLYELVCQIFPKQQRIVLHANHQIQHQSPEWALFARNLSKKHGDHFITKDLILKNNSEQEARKQRYAFFQQVAADYTDPILLLGHHLDDADETALWRFLRGSPLGGVVGIARSCTGQQLCLLRPLLNISREQIEAYAREYQLSWMSDLSNEANTYTRNFLRNAIIAPLKERSLQNISHSRQRLHDDYNALIAHQKFFLENPWRLQLKDYPLKELSHQRSLMQNWLSKHQQPQPSYEAMTQFLQQCTSNTSTTPLLQLPDGQILASYGGQIWRESSLWWSTEHPAPQTITQKSGSWGLVSFSGLSKVVVIRRLCKKDRLPGMPKAQDYWRDIQLPPWRRPFYPLIEQDGRVVQYGRVWCYSNITALVDFDWGCLGDFVDNAYLV